MVARSALGWEARRDRWLKVYLPSSRRRESLGPGSQACFKHWSPPPSSVRLALRYGDQTQLKLSEVNPEMAGRKSDVKMQSLQRCCPWMYMFQTYL